MIFIKKFQIRDKIIITLQRILLKLSYSFFGYFVKPQKNSWVVGVDEIANQINYISSKFENKITVNLNKTSFYKDVRYDYNLYALNLSPYWRVQTRRFLAPILLGYLANKVTGFIYIWNSGFLSNHDGRAYEFSFLKSKQKKIVTYFCGTDIRSHKLALEYGASSEIDVMSSYFSLLDKKFLSDEYDKKIELTAEAADKYADHIFSCPVDQISYIKNKIHPFIYFIPEESFVKNDAKFSADKIKIVHAASSPFIKGTPVIRAAIKKLKVMGYEFEYRELFNSSNDEVFDHLSTAQIAIGQLYSFVPGLFALEAMAYHCAVLTSATGQVEFLPEGSDQAWMVTRYWEIFDNLKLLLDQPKKIKQQADVGYDWTYKNYRSSKSYADLKSIIQQD